ncbi:MAG: hypothetical protein RBR53_08015 [Desulforegulaceae bacterium]|nr:hypothetical protein [Desulforegulaceae bacterium]
MYYIGIYKKDNDFYFFAALMHRKTAKRTYEPFICEVFKNSDYSDFEKIISKYQASNDFVLMKKKFSQSGRPARKVLVPPEFVYIEDNQITKIMEKLRVSKSRIVLNGNVQANENDISVSKEQILSSAKNTMNDKRIVFENFKPDFDLESELEKLETQDFDMAHPFIKAFSLILAKNELSKIKIKRY